MKRFILFIHGGGAFEEGRKMAASIREALGGSCEVRCPKMPDEDRPEYEAWKRKLSEELSVVDGKAVLVGHSLGASILLKFLSEEEPEIPVAGLFLLAPPFWGTEEWEVDEYALRRDFASRLPGSIPTFLYHSRDDEVVPFSHLALYAEKLPRAAVRDLGNQGHYFGDLSEVARDIESL